jgi:hypothetical protein
VHSLSWNEKCHHPFISRLEKQMRSHFGIVFLAMSTSLVLAQQTPPSDPTPHPTPRQAESIGGPAIPENAEQKQSQGKTGPLETKGNGARPENPQGGTPEGMQVHPVEPK